MAISVKYFGKPDDYPTDGSLPARQGKAVGKKKTLQPSIRYFGYSRKINEIEAILMALHALPIEAEIEVMVENSIWSITGRVWVWDESVQIAVEEAIADIEAIASHITTTFPEWDYKMSYSCNKI